MSGKGRISALVAVLALVLVPPAGVGAGGAAWAADKPTVELSKSQAGTGGSITVSGTGWRPQTLLMMLICGRSTPSRGVIGGTNSCANADGRAVTTDAKGAFDKALPVVEPPVPCPCVVHVATVTGEKAEADAIFQVAGHAVEPLPDEAAGGRLSVLTDTRLDGSSGLLTWFGAPPARRLVFTVGNVGTSPVRNPVFQVGTSHGVFAPDWEEQQWRGTLQPGKKARISLPVELAAGAHGDYTVSLKYGGKVLAEQPWGVGRPWGVTLFWILLAVVVPAALFRIGMAVVDRARPRAQVPGRRRGRWWSGLAVRLPGPVSKRSAAHSRTTGKPSRSSGELPAETTSRTTPALPWFSPDTGPGTAAGQLSAPQESGSTSPTGRKTAKTPPGPTTPTRKGNT
ncbi:hypothetical protein ACFS5L_41605 [Streptomyces phyllanthi]|uniref:Neocarzinostatin family protein n=1 Tax=Streptomyces phyllanthi TaxID=1803180 RepID=A0A5N8WES0_9ACTN|nr:hypothetical protein [Streptomyces phyllanthi]MPY45970.1 hypothetical protein [Streptomyces phyllanthi]